MSETSNDETVDHLKVAQITRHDLVAEMQRGDADLKIRKRNSDTRYPRLGVEPCRQFAHFPCERLDAYGGESLLQIQLPLLRTLGIIRTPESMTEFNHADRGNYDLSGSDGSSNFPQKFADGLRATLGGDQHVRIEY
jgi:hypothetical protein